MHYLLLFIIAFLIDLIPAFGPPAWIASVYFKNKYNLDFVAVVILTATATASGRLLLATLTRKLRNHIPKRYSKNLLYSQKILKSNRQKSRLFFGLFILSPLPSAQLFEAAGLLEVRLLPLAGAFFFGRLITISLYLLFAHFTVTTFSQLLQEGVSSVWAIIFESLCILGLIAMFKMPTIVNWVNRRRQKS